MSQQIHEEIGAIQKHLAFSEVLLDAMRPTAKEQHWFLLAEAMCLSTGRMLKIVEKALVVDDAKGDIPNCPRCKRPLLWKENKWVCEDTVCVGAAVCSEMEKAGMPNPLNDPAPEPTFREGDEVVYDPDRDIAGRLFWEKRRGIVRCVDAGVIGVRFDGFVTWYFTRHRARKTLLLKVPEICADSGQTLSFEERHKRLVEVTYRDGAIEGTMVGLPTGICYDDRYGWLLSLRSPNLGEAGSTIPFKQILYWRPARRAEEKGANGQAVNLATGKAETKQAGLYPQDAIDMVYREMCRQEGKGYHPGFGTDYWGWTLDMAYGICEVLKEQGRARIIFDGHGIPIYEAIKPVAPKSPAD